MVWLFLWLFLTGCALLLWGIRHERKVRQFERFNLKTDSVSGHKFRKWGIQLLNHLISGDDRNIRHQFLAAGFYDFKWSHLYIPVKYAVLLCGCIGFYGLSVLLAWQTMLLITMIAGWVILILIVPDAYLLLRTKQFARAIAVKLPYLLDLMAVCVQSGMTIEASISYLSQEIATFDRDLSYLLTQVDERARIVGLEQALDEMYRRVPSSEMRSFVMTLNQSLNYGSSIYQVLTTLSADIRAVHFLQIEEKSGKLAAKMSIPLILFIMIPIVILIAGPGIMRILKVINHV
jgi:tight adherence protein C